MKKKKPLRTAADFLGETQRVVAARAATHGAIVVTQNRIACLWSAYLEIRPNRGCGLDGGDVTVMMQLLKIARGQSVAGNPDNDIDNIGYAALLAEVNAAKRSNR